MADKLTLKQEASLFGGTSPGDPVFYVYALADPRDGEPFYIGKGKGDRCYQHVRNFRNGTEKNARKARRIGIITSLGLEVQVTILASGLTEHQAYRTERAEIAAARKKREITNLAPGMRTEAERALDQVRYNLSRFRSPAQYKSALLRLHKRPPTLVEWEWYFAILRRFADLKERLTKELGGYGSPNNVQT